MISLLLGSFLSTAQAVPMQLSQQGRLVDSSGVAAAGNHNLTFRLYNASTGGTLLWNETVSTNFTNGYYSVVLGSDTINNPLQDSVLESGDLFIEIEIDSDGPLTPRSAVTSTPFARVAGKAQSADWGGLTSIPSDIDDGDDDTVGALSCSVGEQPVYNGSGVWECGNPVDDVDADNRLSALETLVTNLQSDLATANSSISTLEGDLATTQSDLATANATIATLQGSVGDNSTDIGTLDASMTDAQADIADLQTDLTAAEASIATLQTDLSGISDNVLDLISVDTTWNIGTNGDYTDLTDAIAAAKNVRIHPDATLTLQLEDGTFLQSDSILLDTKYGENILIQGNTSDPSAVVLLFNNSNGLELNSGVISLSSLTIQGLGTAGSYSGVRISDSTVYFTDVHITEFSHIGLYVSLRANAYFQGTANSITNNGSTGVYARWGALVYNTESTLDISGNSGNGISAYASTIRLDNLYSQNNQGKGLFASLGTSAQSINGVFSGNSGHNIYFESSTGYIQGADVTGPGAGSNIVYVTSNGYVSNTTSQLAGYNGISINRGSSVQTLTNDVSNNPNGYGINIELGGYGYTQSTSGTVNVSSNSHHNSN